MDLAQAASIFKKSKNLKALGICYNNIANIQYKNAQYHEAAQNFSKAVAAVEKLMEDLKGMLKSKDLMEGVLGEKLSRYEQSVKRESYKAELSYFEKVHAHRIYQYAMSRYKLMRYTPENIKDSTKLNW